MSVATHLSDTASKAVLSTIENLSIATSVSTLKTRLNSCFGSGITADFKFGSYTRDTILPRKIDDNSDVDYMVVFKDADAKPQTYLDRLKRFAEDRYGRSEIYQSHPTVVLELSHIKFELVPAVSIFGGYKIPAPSSQWQEWIATYPNAFNETLTNTNMRHAFHVKPMIRLVKYWNANAGYVFSSYELETYLVNTIYKHNSLKEYVFAAIDSLHVGFNEAQWKKDKVARAKEIVTYTKAYESNGLQNTAETEIKKLFPPIS